MSEVNSEAGRGHEVGSMVDLSEQILRMCGSRCRRVQQQPTDVTQAM